MKYLIVALLMLQVIAFIKSELVTIELKKLAKLKEDSGKLVKMEADLKNLKKKYELFKYLCDNYESEFMKRKIKTRLSQTNETEQNHQSGAPNIIQNKSYMETFVMIHSNQLAKLEEDSKKFAKIEADFKEIQAKINVLEELDYLDGNVIKLPLEQLRGLAGEFAEINDPGNW